MLAISLGDPFSINIDAICKLMQENTSPDIKVVLVGSLEVFEYQASLQTPIKIIANWNEAHIGWNFLDTGLKVKELDPRKMSTRQRGEIASRALYELKNIGKQDKLAVLTSPIDKQACSQAGFEFPGQTEYFADIWQGDSIMILAGPKLRVGLATNHLALKDVASSITPGVIRKKITLLSESISKYIGIDKPKIGVCGLNPHASDKGLFGSEESNIIEPVIKSLEQDISGPLPADTLFHSAYNGNFDAVLAMYHDQGLGPLKTVHFYDAVNITGGLKHLRVSPDHGPASDLYGSNKANFQSFKEAFKICISYLER